MGISSVDAIEPAIEHAKQQLLRPFRFGQWIRLALTGVLAGELGSAGGCNFNFQVPSQHRGVTTTILGTRPLPDWIMHAWKEPGVLMAVILVAASLLVAILYISSVMRFILFDSVVERECHIRRGWRRRSRVGAQLFAWRILLALVSLMGFVVLVVVPVGTVWMLGWLFNLRQHLWPVILGVLVLVPVFLTLVAVLVVVHVMTKDFVVPQMALESISAFEGWRRLWPRVKGEKSAYTGYLGMKLVLAVGVAIALGIVSLAAMLVILLPVAGVALVAILGGAAAGWTWNLSTIALCVAGMFILLLLVILVISLVNVPAIVFFPAYSIYFFAGRYEPLGRLLWPATAGGPAPPTPLPPALPPNPALAG